MDEPLRCIRDHRKCLGIAGSTMTTLREQESKVVSRPKKNAVVLGFWQQPIKAGQEQPEPRASPWRIRDFFRSPSQMLTPCAQRM